MQIDREDEEVVARKGAMIEYGIYVSLNLLSLYVAYLGITKEQCLIIENQIFDMHLFSNTLS